MVMSMRLSIIIFFVELTPHTRFENLHWDICLSSAVASFSRLGMVACVSCALVFCIRRWRLAAGAAIMKEEVLEARCQHESSRL